ncbi:MAG: AIPR family protein, partial [Desulfamplus sp.]|nr:AIPR family protein [Desulfamplus sp.]
CMSNCLEISMDEAAELLTDGGNDAGVDGLHISEVEDGEFLVTIFQGKYKVKDLGGDANFPENAVQKVVNTVGTLFDPDKHIELNPVIKPKIEEIRSLVRDGYIPNVRVILCNNGAKWNAQAQLWIDQSKLPENQIQWVHFNHDSIIDILRKTKSVNDTLLFSGQAVVEDFNFRRILVGKVKVSVIAELFEKHSDLLLERNIRRYLGLHSNRVNLAIHRTLKEPEQRGNFYFFNNGITVICRKFRYNALQGSNYQVKLEGMQVINGGQTCKTIQQTLNDPDLFAEYENIYVMVRIYELAEDDQDFVRDITYATNNQNPVDLRDLRSNDEIQKQLELGIKGFGYSYKRQREKQKDEKEAAEKKVSSSLVAESVLAVWIEKPHQAKFLRREHFGKLYEEIFKNLNAAQALLAVTIFRKVENERKRLEGAGYSEIDFLPYASYYIAMVIGRTLLSDHKLSINNVNHRNYDELVKSLESSIELYHKRASDLIRSGLVKCYGERKISLQQLSATFRRGDLLEMLKEE